MRNIITHIEEWRFVKCMYGETKFSKACTLSKICTYMQNIQYIAYSLNSVLNMKACSYGDTEVESS